MRPPQRTLKNMKGEVEILCAMYLSPETKRDFVDELFKPVIDSNRGLGKN